MNLMIDDQDRNPIEEAIENTLKENEMQGNGLVLMENVRIDSGIPIPAKRWTVKGRGKWVTVVSQMQKGDSVLLLSENDAKYLTNVLRRDGIQSSTRKVEGGWRVWRLS